MVIILTMAAYAGLKIHFLVLGTALLVILALPISDMRAWALQQVAGEINTSVEPGGMSSFQWGLLSDSEEQIQIQLRAEGEGAEFLSFPNSVVLEPGKLYWVTVNVTVPGNNPGTLELQPSLYATELGEQGGTTVINIQMQKVVKLNILPNPDTSLASKSLPAFTDYLETVKIGEEEIQLLVQSSSEVSDFVFDEAEKKVSFRVSGAESTGSTIVSIGSILTGPYTISVDGDMSSYESMVSDNGSQESIRISHYQNVHDITITGTSVVPEFSIPILIVAATLTIAIASRPLRHRATGTP